MEFTETNSGAGTAAIAALPRPLAHLKGFASRLALPGCAVADGKPLKDIELQTARTEAAIASLVSAIRDAGIRTLCWDGDSLADDSFTTVLLRVRAAVPGIALAAFLFAGSRPRFSKSWAPRSIAGLQAFVVPEGATDATDAASHTQRFAQLGVAALALTGAERVFCLGGGDVVRAEFDLRPPTASAWAVAAVSRWGVTRTMRGADRAFWEPCALYAPGIEQLPVLATAEHAGAPGPPGGGAPGRQQSGE